MVGAMPRREGMERKDLLAANVKIFKVSILIITVLIVLRVDWILKISKPLLSKRNKFFGQEMSKHITHYPQFLKVPPSL